jgi:large subunit ribosomal protein L21
MYAIVEIAGKQFRVSKDMKLKVPLLESEPGKKVGFDRVLLVEDDKGNATIGNPVVKSMQVSATVLEHGREKKVIVFKKKRRKGYQKTRGHRQGYSVIEINAIGASAAKTTAPAAKKKPATAEKKVVEKAAAKPVKPKATVKKTAVTTSEKTSAKSEAKPTKAAPRITSTKSAAVKPAADTKTAAKKKTKEE